ncbi:MAG: ribosomal protein S18-alanine N-acetyltransferase [Deltaproteobacteria bacterium]
MRVRAEQPGHDLERGHFPFDVCRMGLGDLEEVMAVERLAFKHPWSTELFRRELLHDWSTVLLCVRPDGQHEGEAPSPRVLGFVIFWLVHDEVHVLNLACHPAARRIGIARRLMVEAIEQGRGRGAALVTLEVRRSNFPALSLYRDLGFRSVGIRPNYYVDEGEDAVVMILDL